MTEQIKYEAVFGDQTLLDYAPEDAEAVFKSNGHDSKCVYYKLSNGHMRYHFGEWIAVNSFPPIDSQTLNAMRRVIKVPRWTKADQKAGRLPEVGTMVKETKYKVSPQMPSGLGDGYECKVLGIYEGEVCLQFDDGSMRIDSVNNIEPIETDKEKAERLEDEWVEAAIYETVKRKDTTNDEHERLKVRLGDVYRALLSGDLPVPVKGE